MKLIIDVPDDFLAGECYDYTNGAKCPFAARGCWAGAKGFEKCPLKEAEPAVEIKPAVPASLVEIWGGIYQRLLNGGKSYKQVEAVREVMDEIFARYRPTGQVTGLDKFIESMKKRYPKRGRQEVDMDCIADEALKLQKEERYGH